MVPVLHLQTNTPFYYLIGLLSGDGIRPIRKLTLVTDWGEVYRILEEIKGNNKRSLQVVDQPIIIPIQMKVDSIHEIVCNISRI